MARARVIVLCLSILSLLSGALAAQSLELLYQDDTGETGYDVAVSSGMTYVSNNAGVSIYSLADPESPTLLTHPDWAGGPVFGLALHGNILYVAAIDRGLLIVDVSEPSTPTVLSRYGSNVGSVFSHNNLVFLTGRNRPLQILDASDPSNPRVLSETPWPNADGLACAGDYMFITDPNRGVVQFDISDPTNPVELGALRNTHSAYRLEIRDNVLAVAMYTRGVLAFTLDNPRYPRAVSSFSHTGEAWDVSGDYPILVVADLQEGVEVLDMSAPAMNRLILADDSWAPHSLYCEDGYVHLADQDDVYVLLRLHLEDGS